MIVDASKEHEEQEKDADYTKNTCCHFGEFKAAVMAGNVYSSNAVYEESYYADTAENDNAFGKRKGNKRRKGCKDA